MADRSISISLEAKVQGFVSGLKTAQQASKDFASRTAAFARENEQQMDRVGKAGMVMGGGLLAGVGLAVKTFADFDRAMSSVRASTRETAGNMDLLRQAAIDAGADTAFSASEAAGAIDELAKAGVSTKDILGGGLKGALSLAAAGSLGVGEAAEVAASAMTQFKLSGEDIPHIADLLAAGAGKAQGSVQDMGAALNQAGLVAANTGLTIEEATGGLAAFASAGLTGSDAGTSFKTMLGALTPNSEAAKTAMDELGISAYDSQGNFVGLSEFAGQLKDSMSGLSAEQRNATMETIFGSDAVRAASVLYEQGAAGVEKWEAAVNDAGFAAETAAIRQDNLAGDFEKLSGSLDSVFLQSGTGANDVLRGLVQSAEDFVDAIGDIPTPVLNAAVGIAAVTGGALLLGGAFVGLLPKVVEFKDSLDQIAPKGSKAAGVIGSVGKAAGIATVALIALQAAGAVFTDKEIKSAEDFGQALLKVGKAGSGGLDSVFQGWDKLALGETVADVDGMADAVRRLTNQNFGDWLNTNFADPLNGLLGFAKSDVSQVTERFKGLGDAMGGLVKNGGADTAAESFKVLTAEFERNGKGAQDALNAVPGYKDALQGLANEAGAVVEGQDLLDFAMGKVPASMAAASGAAQTYTNAAGQSVPITEDMANALEDVGLSATGAVTALDKYAAALVRAGLSNLSVSDAARNYEAAIDAVTDSIATNGSSLDIHTAKGRANQAALDGVASAGLAQVETMAKATDAFGNNIYTQSQLHSAMSTTYQSMITAAGQFGITGAAADALARKALGIPPNVNIEAYLKDFASQQIDNVGVKLANLDGKTANTYVINHERNVIENVVTSSHGRNNTGGRQGAKPTFQATGGPITGPGTGTSDDIPAWLSNGEHVLTAEEVRRMGGHAAVERMRAMAKSGQLPRFASGGAVQRRREMAAGRREFWMDYQRDSRRGDGYRSVTENASSAYSFADRLTSLADSGNVGTAALRRLYAAAGRGEAGLRTLHARSDRLSTSLEKAKGKLEDLVEVRNSIGGDLAGGFKIGDAVKRGNMYGEATVSGIQGEAKGYLSRVQAFAGKLKALQKMGYSGAIVQEIAEMGLVEGSRAADVLLKGTKSEVGALNKTKAAIGSASTAAGNAVADALHKGGISAAAGFVKGLQAQEKAIERQMLRIGLGMENALRSALGQKPIRRSGGGPVEGPGTGTSDDVPALLSDGEHVWTAAEVAAVGGHDAMYRMRAQARGYRYAPAAAPRIHTPAAAPSAAAGPVTHNWSIHEQADPVATAHEVARRQRALST